MSPAPTTTSDPPPHTTTCSQQCMAAVNTHFVALDIQPKTENELLLLSALWESENFCQQLKTHAFKLQAFNILNKVYTAHLKKQLAMKEAKKMTKKAMKLIGDGLPWLLSSDDFYELAKQKEQEGCTKAQKKAERVEARKLYDEAIAQWKTDKETRKKEAAEVKVKNAKAKEAYEKKKAQVKKGKTFKGTKPTMLLIPKVILKPKLKDFIEGAVGGAPEAGGDDDGEVFEAVEKESSEDDDDDA